MTLRVLFLAERYPPDVAGGGELSAAMVARAVADQPNVHVRVITQGDGTVDHLDGIEVMRIIPRAPASLPDDITRAELLTARAAPQTAKALRGADLVHSVSPRAIPTAVAAAKLARKPATSVMNDNWATCFVHSHVRGTEYCPTCFPEGLRECLDDVGGNVSAAPIVWRQFRRRIKAVRSLAGVVAISPTIEALLRAHDVHVPISVIPVPFDPEPWRAATDERPEAGTVLFVGRMAPEKGPLETVETFALAAMDRPRAKLVMVGEGPLLEETRSRAAHLGLLKVGNAWTVDAMVVFNDPNLYGLRLALAGSKAGGLANLAVDILYKKITDDIGVFQIDFTFPDAIRNLNFGMVSITLPQLGIKVYTNGDFFIDIGFPYNLDFRRSFSIAAIVYGVPVLGSGGLYFGKLSNATATQVPKTNNGTDQNERQ